SGKRVEFKLLDRLYNFDRLARCPGIIKPAARREHLFIQLQNPVGEGITVPEIVKEPAIQFGCAQGSLNFSHSFCWRLLCVHRGDKGETKNGCEGRELVRCHRASTLLNKTPHVIVSISESVDRSGADRTLDQAEVARE